VIQAHNGGACDTEEIITDSEQARCISSETSLSASCTLYSLLIT